MSSITPFSASLTMSSKEIADLLGTRHDVVKRTIERLATKEDRDGKPAPVIQLPPMVEVKNHLGQTVTEAGRFDVKTGATNGHAYHQARFTPAGVAWIADKWAGLTRLMPNTVQVTNHARS